MAEIISVRTVYDFDGNGVIDQMINRRFYTIKIPVDINHPLGRKGKAFVTAWKQLKGDANNNAGMLVLDQDVALDPHDYKMMLQSIDRYPDDVSLAPVKIWPVSTKRPDWVWGHATEEDRSQISHDNPKYFSFCFTYLPKRLINACIKAGWENWDYPGADTPVALKAFVMGIPKHVVKDCMPKHMNY